MNVPKDNEGNAIDFYKRSMYSVVGQNVEDQEFRMIPWYPPLTPDPLVALAADGPHLVGSLLEIEGTEVHAPALDIDFHMAQLEIRQPDQDTLQALKFETPEHAGYDDLLNLSEALKHLHMVDDTTVTSYRDINRNKHVAEITLHFHPKTRIHLVRSTTQGHHHLYINRMMKWDDYVYLMSAMAEARVISSAYCDFSIMRRQSFLRFPGITKVQLPSPTSEATGRSIFKTPPSVNSPF